MLHFITFCRHVPAVSRHSFICSRISSVWRSIGTGRTSPVSGSNGGSSETKTMPPPRGVGAKPGELDQCEVGTFADAEIRGRNQATQTFGGHRTGQKIPLQQIAPELLEKRVVFNGLDTFGQNTTVAAGNRDLHGRRRNHRARVRHPDPSGREARFERCSTVQAANLPSTRE